MKFCTYDDCDAIATNIVAVPLEPGIGVLMFECPDHAADAVFDGALDVTAHFMSMAAMLLSGESS